jgi:hypothetical protein
MKEYERIEGIEDTYDYRSYDQSSFVCLPGEQEVIDDHGGCAAYPVRHVGGHPKTEDRWNREPT